MGQTPNYKFSVTRGRTVTQFESVLDSVKRHIQYPFPKTGKRQHYLKAKSADLLESMGNKREKQTSRTDGDETPISFYHPKEQKNGRGRQDVEWHDDRISGMSNRHSDEPNVDSNSLDNQTHQGTDLYITRVDDLRNKLEACHNATKDTLIFYKQHRRTIQKAEQTKQRLNEATEQCIELKTTIRNLQNIAGEKERELVKKEAHVESERIAVENLRQDADRRKDRLEAERKAFESEMSKQNIGQRSKLEEEKKELKAKHDLEYSKRVEELQNETKKLQDANRKTLLDLQIDNEKLSDSLAEQTDKLQGTEKKLKNMETSHELAITRVGVLSQKLKTAENEFELCSSSPEFFKNEFLEINNKMVAISTRYVDKIALNDLDESTRNKIVELDRDFDFVPMSISSVSKQLCIAHFQRVITSQLHAIFWQPFSSELTLEGHKDTSLLNQIYLGLANNLHKDGFHAARTCAALITRSLRSQSNTTKRLEIFADRVMEVLSLLVTQKSHTNLRKDLTQLAKAAVSLWNIIQNNEFDIVVHATLDPANFEQPEDETNVSERRIFVLFPSVTARICQRKDDSRPVGLPGSWEEPKSEFEIEEICIHEGAGLPDWSELVRKGEEEEEDRRKNQLIENAKKEKEKADEKLKKLSTSGTMRPRRPSENRRNSVIGNSSPSTPTSTRLHDQKIPERE